MTREQFFEAMEKHQQVLQEAHKVIAKHGIEGNDIEVDAVALADNKKEVHIRYVFKWGGVYEHDSIIVPAEEFWKEGQVDGQS